MNAQENDRLGIVESDVKRILTILDDPDFGLRTELRAQKEKVRQIELKVYTVLAAVGGAALLWAGVLVKSITGG